MFIVFVMLLQIDYPKNDNENCSIWPNSHTQCKAAEHFANQ